MIKESIVPSDLFQTIGKTMGDALIDDQQSNLRYRISKITMEMQLELSPNLEKLSLPSNKQKHMDGKQPVNLFKISVNAR